MRNERKTSRMSQRRNDLEPDDSDRAGGIQVIARAARILRALESHPDGLSLGQIAKSVGLARSTAQRIVAALVVEQFVVSSGPGDVRIGPGLVRLAASVGSNTVDTIRPHLRAFGDEIGETVDLAVLSGGSVVFVDQVQGRQRLAALSAIGERFPLHCTANGKAVLACFAAEDAAELIDKSVTEHSSHPLRNRSRLLKELDKTRASHLAFDIDEHGEGISAIGTAFIDIFGRPIAISVPVPSKRFAEQRELLAERMLVFRNKIRTLLAH